ncbi:hypothetical protein [uncultured Maricaulis sp.]|uniref:hypothetical protein n=1 Tax=uncultured Maricaulis sp. TaxID=174710 RepID=UPI0030DAF7A2
MLTIASATNHSHRYAARSYNLGRLIGCSTMQLLHSIEDGLVTITSRELERLPG